MASGLDATGLSIKRLAELIDEMGADAVAKFGDQIQLQTPDSVSGLFIELVATQLAEVWELAQQQYDSFDPDQAEGAQLDNVSALVGVTREPATNSVVVLELDASIATVVPAGSIYRVPNGPKFVTTEEVVVSGPTPVNAESQDTGPITATAGTITEQVTIIGGIDSVTNPADAEPGRNVETDQELRTRRENSLQIIGAGPDQAIASRLAALLTVEQAVVISNRTLVTDVLGIPGKAFRAVVWPVQTSNDPVFEAIWATQPAGILADGTITGTVLDTTGNSQPVAYSVATQVSIHAEATLTTTSAYEGNDAVKAAIQGYINDLNIGDDVLYHQVLCAISQVQGILTIALLIDTVDPPTGTANITIDQVSIARIDLGDIDIL